MFRSAGIAVLLGALAASLATSSLAQGAAARPAAKPRQAVRFMQLGESLAWLPYQVARGRNCFANAGLDVTWVPGPVNAAQAVLGLMTNQADVAGIGTNAVLSAIDAGRPIVAFGAGAKGETQVLVLRNDVIADLKSRLSVDPSSPIAARVQALKGLRIAANTAGGTVMLALEAALAEFGVDPRSGQVQLQSIEGTPAMYAAMRQKRIDGFMFSPPAPLQAVVDKEGSVWFSGGEGVIKSWVGSYASIYATTSRYATDHPQVLRILMDCVQEASHLIKANPAAAAAAARPFYTQTQDQAFALSFDAVKGVFFEGPHTTEKGFQITVDKYNATLGTPIKVSYRRAFEAEPR